MVDVSAKNFPRTLYRKEWSNRQILASLCIEEEHRAISHFKNLEDLAQDVKFAFEQCSRKTGLMREEEVGVQSIMKFTWNDILRLRSLHIPETDLNKDFREALLCRGREEYKDWPFSMWNYEQYRKMRHTWSEFFRCDPEWDRHLKDTYLLRTAP